MSPIFYKDLSYAVVGCAMRVHSALGPGFPEAVYQKALAKELADQKIVFRSQAEFEVFYQESLCGKFKADFLVDELIIVEIKAVESLTDEHRAQTLAYLKATNLKLGILVSFGQKRMVSERIVN